MNTHLQFLTATEAKTVYKAHLKHHFPKDETKPWKSIERMWKRDEYFAVGIYEDDVSAGSDALRGYAFFVEPKGCDACLLDYYAILPEYRDAGLGGHTLQQLAELVRGKGRYILLETEDIDFAKTKEEVAERTRRNAFYARNGCIKTDTKGAVFGEKYAIWALGLSELLSPSGASFSDAAVGAHLSDAELTKVCEDMNALYQLMVPGEKNKLFIKIKRSRPD